jgi:hypothetical protein
VIPAPGGSAQGLWMTRRSALAVTALTLVSVSACGGGGADEAPVGRTRPLIVYSREGGIRFQSSTLVVKTKGFAVLITSDGCMARFRLGVRALRRLGQARRRVDLPSLAGDYPARAGAADVITETVTVDGDTVRIADFSSLPIRGRRELTPLLAALGEVLAEGERDTRSRCGGEEGEGQTQLAPDQ